MVETYHFKIGWKFPKCKPMVSDYAAPNLRTLLRLIEDSEGISTKTTEYLVIHQILPFGGVKEVLAHDMEAGSLKVDFSPAGSIKRAEYQQEASNEHDVVTKVSELLHAAAKDTGNKKQKPRIRLKGNKAEAPRVASFLYVATEAQ